MTVEDVIAMLSKLDPKMVAAVPVGMQWRPVSHVEVAEALKDERYGYLTKLHPRHCSPEKTTRMVFICPS